MINNWICPYCRKKMIKAENNDLSRSVEHLIPNAVLTRKRKNDEGDFYACRKCNSKKSHVDNLLGVLSKCQSDNEELATETITKVVTKGDGTSKRFIDIISTAHEATNEVYLDGLITGPELFEYITLLGKGQYFKKRGILFNPSQLAMKIVSANKQVTISIKGPYQNKHNSNPFRDLEKNKYSEVINGGECIIYSKNNNYMFLLHDYTAIIVRILKRNKKNIAKAVKSENQLLQEFSNYT